MAKQKRVQHVAQAAVLLKERPGRYIVQANSRRVQARSQHGHRRKEEKDRYQIVEPGDWHNYQCWEISPEVLSALLEEGEVVPEGRKWVPTR